MHQLSSQLSSAEASSIMKVNLTIMPFGVNFQISVEALGRADEVAVGFTPNLVRIIKGLLSGMLLVFSLSSYLARISVLYFFCT